MRSSFQRRLVIAVGIALGSGVFVSGYVLSKFRGYEDAASRVMSGDQRTVVQGHLIEARVKAAEELALNSVNSEQANANFREKLIGINDDVRNLSKDHPDKHLDEIKKQLNALISAKQEPLEDLFVHYRNLKTSAFNVYRAAWANKWMTIAHNVGLIINDLDNLPYHAGEKAVASVYAKISPLIALITRSPLSQDAKLQLFGHLNTLKAQVAQYNEAAARSDKVKEQRLEDLKALATTLKKYNESQGKSMLQFGNEARTEVFKAMIAFGLFILFAMAWYWFALSTIGAHVRAIADHFTEQFKGWLSPSGNSTASGFTQPEKPDAELLEAYRAIDQTLKRVTALRKEDVLIKRLLNVPVVLVNRNKQAIFWNSALSILGKVRALEELGAVPYANLLRFTSVQGKAVDPIDKAFADNKEVAQLALMRVGDDGLAVQATCTPVLGADHQAEYVMVHIRDLRDENKRAEAELDRQLECVRSAVEFVKAGKVPPDAGPSLRKPVVDTVLALKSHALALQEQASIMAGQVETMRSRMEREAGLKKTVHGRVEQVSGEIASVRAALAELRAASDSVTVKFGQIEARGKLLRTEYDDIRRRGQDLARDLKASQGLVSQCIARLAQTEEISTRVRANERMIRGLLEKSTVLNANNSILGSKRELTPSDVVTITENITQLMNQFDRSYRFIEQSVGDVERGLADLTTKLHDNLATVSKLSSDDHDLVRAVQESEKLVVASTGETAEVGREVVHLKAAANRLATDIKAVEAKIQRLVQIGQASLALQSQLEIGFQGMFGTVGPANNGAARGLGGSA
ncbi:MAG: hypothetical protein HY075_09965 [Deltaproteobacteria bacterium]|nr:hypothetical protein [Deltaproteobacteria bacterium]